MARKIMPQDVAKDAERKDVQKSEIVCRGCTIGDRELTSITTVRFFESGGACERTVSSSHSTSQTD